MRAWRITRRVHVTSAFTGYGSARVGQRWNSKAVYVVYCASSMALAHLEQLVHIGRENAPDDLVACAVDIPDDAIETCDPASLPAYWRNEPPPRELAEIADAWVLSGTSLGLRVPSAVSPEDANIVINPQHHRISELRIGEPFDVVLDPRLLR